MLFSGGWTLVSNVTGKSKSPLAAVLPSSLNNLLEGKENIFLSVTALKELWSMIKFSQIRWKCFKNFHGRTIDIATSTTDNGKNVFNYFLGDTDTQPSVTQDSFVKLPEDTSSMSVTPTAEWGEFNALGKWGHPSVAKENRLIDHPFFKRLFYHWNLGIGLAAANRWECDDYLTAVSTNDYWQLFVR